MMKKRNSKIVAFRQSKATGGVNIIKRADPEIDFLKGLWTHSWYDYIIVYTLIVHNKMLSEAGRSYNKTRVVSPYRTRQRFRYYQLPPV